MKNNHRSQILTLFSALLVLVSPAMLVASAAPSPEILMAAAVAADEAESAITGKVVSKSDNSLQIDGHAVLVTESTVYVRNGAPARLADIQAGDEVSATCAKGADGSLVAIRIEVTVAAS